MTAQRVFECASVTGVVVQKLELFLFQCHQGRGLREVWAVGAQELLDFAARISLIQDSCIKFIQHQNGQRRRSYSGGSLPTTLTAANVVMCLFGHSGGVLVGRLKDSDCL